MHGHRVPGRSTALINSVLGSRKVFYDSPRPRPRPQLATTATCTTKDYYTTARRYRVRGTR